MKKIAITGAKGTIGTALKRGLTEYEITPIDLPELDVRDHEKLLDAVSGHSVVIHLAWDAKAENFRNGGLNPDNFLMAHNVYRAALEVKIPRVIMASSVHADNFYGWKDLGLLSPDRVPVPDSPYGASKVFIEALGRCYATKGLEVVCIRFGGVNAANKPPLDDYYEKAVWLSHDDCIGLVRSCIEGKSIPNNYLIVYGVSDNENRIHDFLNPLGWMPKRGESVRR
ncbi:NAD(P)-dependent oxidoreductase [Candidatus Woesearchaeota archaeon]|nr:NAD(P)-dependent oxidoreductase [Candidatus Woesearchaeota archaeon]